jgi:Domain of unknown function (DUF4350)
VTRWKWPAAVTAVVVAGSLAVALSVPSTTTQDLDPRSAAPGGTRALARVLEQQGVRVRRVLTAGDAAAAAGAGTTLVVVHPNLVGPEQLDRLAALSSDLVLVEPDAVVLDALAPGIAAAGVVEPRPADPGCSAVDPSAAGRARAGGHLYRPDPAGTSAARVTGLALCYRDDADHAAGSWLAADLDGRRVGVVGQADVLRNGYLAQDGNAALALRTLGRSPAVIWYLPGPSELGTQTPTLSDLVPTWIWWAIAQLAVGLLVALVWRARRLGRLVVEPLPVVVRSAETQEGRARLYRQSRARGRAAATLRTAALRRLAARIDVPAQTSPLDLAGLVAAACGLSESEVRSVLLGPEPADDAALVVLADRIDAVEAAIARRATPEPERAPTR